MTTTIVNVYKESFDVYIGRTGRSHSGYFGNPYKVGAVCQRCGRAHLTGGSTLACYRAYFYERLEKDPDYKARILALRGKRLGCFCKPKPCHGDVIAEYLDSQEKT